MEQRRNTRLVLDRTVNLTVLGDVEIRRTAKVKNISSRGLGLEMAFPVGVGCALKIELNDAVLVGEAMYCRAVDGAYYVGIELCAVRRTGSRSPEGLCGLSELSRAVRAFSKEPSRVH
jgi:hypothetical protein